VAVVILHVHKLGNKQRLVPLTA